MPLNLSSQPSVLSLKHKAERIFTAMKIQVAVFWVMTPCSDVVGYQRFGEPCCLHLQGCSYLRPNLGSETADYIKPCVTFLTPARQTMNTSVEYTKQFPLTPL
jgi:hypothetical protein